MRFDLRQNFRRPAQEPPPRSHPERGGVVTLIDPEEICRFEGEGGLKAPVPNLVDVPLDNAIWRRPRWAVQQTGNQRK